MYTDPAHLVEYTSDGEVRQEYEVTLIERPIDGTPSATTETSASRWVSAADLDGLDIHPTMRRQIDHYLSGDYPVVD